MRELIARLIGCRRDQPYELQMAECFEHKGRTRRSLTHSPLSEEDEQFFHRHTIMIGQAGEDIFRELPFALFFLQLLGHFLPI